MNENSSFDEMENKRPSESQTEKNVQHNENSPFVEGEQPENEKAEVQANQESIRYEETGARTNPGLTKPKQPKKQSSRNNGSSKSGFLGGFFGGIVASVLVVLLFVNNLLPFAKADDTPQYSATKEEPNSQEVIKTIRSEDANTATNIEEASKAVVGVINLQQQDIWTQSEEAGTGSGIIYKKEKGKAYVVTNDHVVDGAQEIEIVLNSDEHIKAKVLGTDKLTDLAILEVDGSNIDTVAQLGSSKDVKVGDTVLAIGNPLGMEFANSLTKGIISGLNRSVSVDTNGDRQPDWVTEVIQTDAAINPGNSGGALVDVDGKVIGINSMKIAQSAVEGIGFAIPIDSALPIMEQLAEKGEVERPFIGISTAPINQVPPQYRNQIQLPDDIEGGMVIASVEPGSPAEKAGLQQFDVITKINGEKITSILELRKNLYANASVNDTIKLEFYRNGKKQTVPLKLTERNENI